MRHMIFTPIALLAAALPAHAQQAPRPAPEANGPGRWGGQVNGRWYAGVYAPGGLAAYRRPAAGTVLPTYWNTPSFEVTDWSGYGLPAPRAGQRWSRYYDDAVLVDARGRVVEVRQGLDWEDAPRIAAAPPPPPATVAPPPRVSAAPPPPPAAAAPPPPRVASAPPPPAAVPYSAPRAAPPPPPPRMASAPPPAAGAPYAPPPPAARPAPPPAVASAPPPPPPPPRRDDGVGGAAIGAVAGGAFGNVVAGRGNRLGGTLVGAGVGALAGMAIDRAEDRGRPRDHYDDRYARSDRYAGYEDDYPVAPDDDYGPDYADAPPYGAPYPVPDHRDYPPPPPYGYDAGPGYDGEVVFDDGVTRTVRYSTDRPYTTVTHGPGFVTTVNVIPAVTTTSTRTEYVEPIVKRRVVKRVVHRAPSKLCRCR